MAELLFARQPIFDEDLREVAYKLLFRTDDGSGIGALNGEFATSQVVLKAFTDVENAGVLAGKPAHINTPTTLLTNGTAESMPREQVVLDLPDDLEVPDELLGQIRRLRENGHPIAMTDPIDCPNLAPLAHLASSIKVCTTDRTAEELRARVERLREYDAELLATHIETHEMFAQARKAGFDHFQGYFLAKPRLVKGKIAQANAATIFRVLSAVSAPDLDLADLENVIRMDVGMSYRLLRIINSSFYNLRREIKSIRQALGLLGVRSVRQWVSLMALAGMDGKPPAVFSMAMIRGRMAENLGTATEADNVPAFFLAGLFSSLDAMTDKPLEVVLKQLPLAAEIESALLEGEGILGQAIRCVQAQEMCRLDDLSFPELSDWDVQEAYLEAVKWSADVQQQLGSKPEPV